MEQDNGTEQGSATEQNEAAEQDDAAEQDQAAQDQAAQQDTTAESDEAAKRKRNKAILMGALIVLLIIVIIVLLVFGMRGCAGQTSSAGRVTTSSSGPSADELAASLANRAHAAIHGKSLANGALLCSRVYVIEASGDAITIRLTVPSVSATGMAAACETAVMAAIPEATSVSVVDINDGLVGSAKR